jgi:gas vesicle protein
MNANGESRFRYFLIGMGLGATGAVLSALLARKESREYLREQGAKSLGYLSAGGKMLRESAEGIAQKGRELMSQRCSRCGTPIDVTTGNGSQEDKAEP